MVELVNLVIFGQIKEILLVASQLFNVDQVFVRETGQAERHSRNTLGYVRLLRRIHVETPLPHAENGQV